MKDNQINQIPEVAHNQAILTIQAERQELIRSREHIQNLEKALEEGREANKTLEALLAEGQCRIESMESGRQGELNIITEAKSNALRQKIRADELLEQLHNLQRDVQQLAIGKETGFADKIQDLLEEHNLLDTEPDTGESDGSKECERGEALTRDDMKIISPEGPVSHSGQ